MPVEPSCSRSQRLRNSSSPFLTSPWAATRPARARSTPRESVAGRSGKIRSGRVSAPSPTSELGGDQPVVLVLALVEDTQAVAGGVAEDHEALLGDIELQRRLVEGHRLDVQVAGLDHPRRAPLADAVGAEDLHRPAMAAVIAVPRAAPLVDLLLVGAAGGLLHLGHGPLHRLLEAAVGLLGRLEDAVAGGDVE